ncbi:cobalamin B12-binding domain-containing protein [Jiella sp. MQZ9-1]|uniref:Cobalamin B12-binding domain-containing protein n=1 Tax=Jiella flava TaxID=2816857 RepID=A0A939FZY7_9HYPH|nr:cobalamin B12-binding domain-containing protein [Jiella flava]MBO0663310.1 cobalamin B12-binding domain-containing protein [Jiella flava]MCD2471886.1 cobalamin B12-binding domain-containing protein [Jiella flava]
MSNSIDSYQDNDWRGRLSDAIVKKVIPSLYASHEDDAAKPVNARLEYRQKIEAERFFGLVLSGDTDAQWHHLIGLRARGMDLETVLTRIMAPAIRELGEMWLTDRMSFVEVSAKSARLQHMIRALGRAGDGIADHCVMDDGRASVLLAVAPGEHHTFGLFVLAELFLAAGWSVCVEANTTLESLCDQAARRPYDAIGLSVGSERFLASVRNQVAALRFASFRPDTRIFLGGWAFTLEGRSLDDYGADLIATDGHSAIEQAELLIDGR